MMHLQKLYWWHGVFEVEIISALWSLLEFRDEGAFATEQDQQMLQQYTIVQQDPMWLWLQMIAFWSKECKGSNHEGILWVNLNGAAPKAIHMAKHPWLLQDYPPHIARQVLSTTQSTAMLVSILLYKGYRGRSVIHCPSHCRSTLVSRNILFAYTHFSQSALPSFPRLHFKQSHLSCLDTSNTSITSARYALKARFYKVFAFLWYIAIVDKDSGSRITIVWSTT